MTNWDIIRLWDEYYGIDDDMKKKPEEDFELHTTRPREEESSAERAERIQTIEKAICNVLDRIDALELDLGRLDINKRLTELHEHDHDIWTELDNMWGKLRKPRPIFETLEKLGLVKRCEGRLVLTTRGRQVVELFAVEEIDDLREE
jgi:predicted methyltransferase